MALASQGTIFQIGTGSGVPKNITGITRGAITTITSVAHGFSVGDVVAIAAIVGTTDLNGLSKVIIAKEDDAIFIKVDSSDMDAWDSAGTLTPVTWQSIGEIINGDRAAGGRADIDVTHLTSTAKEYLVGLKDSGEYTFELNWLFNDDGQDALLLAEASDDSYSFKVTYPSTNTCSFDGFVKSVSGPSVGVDDKMSGAVTIRITGEVTFA